MEAKASSAVSIEGPLSSNDKITISGPEDTPTAELAIEFEEDGRSDDDAEKTLDSEEDAPNYSYVNINLVSFFWSLTCRQFSITP